MMKPKTLDRKNDASSKADELTPQDLRRDFLKRFGKYAASTPAVVFTLMSPSTSKAVGSFNNEGGPK